MTALKRRTIAIYLNKYQIRTHKYYIGWKYLFEFESVELSRCVVNALSKVLNRPALLQEGRRAEINSSHLSADTRQHYVHTLDRTQKRLKKESTAMILQ